MKKIFTLALLLGTVSAQADIGCSEALEIIRKNIGRDFAQAEIPEGPRGGRAGRAAPISSKRGGRRPGLGCKKKDRQGQGTAQLSTWPMGREAVERRKWPQALCSELEPLGQCDFHR